RSAPAPTPCNCRCGAYSRAGRHRHQPVRLPPAAPSSGAANREPWNPLLESCEDDSSLFDIGTIPTHFHNPAQTHPRPAPPLSAKRSLPPLTAPPPPPPDGGRGHAE